MNLSEKIKLKISEQKKNRKAIIDWDAVFKDNAIFELQALQKDFKRFISLHKMLQAEKTFENLKDCFRNYCATVQVEEV